MKDRKGVKALAESLFSLGSEMRQLRRARQMTLKALSEASGVSLSHLSAIERGASQPSIEILGNIAAALSVTPDWFFAPRPGGGPMERACVVRAQNRRNLNALYQQDAAELGYTDALLSSTIGGNFYMGVSVYEPNAAPPDDTMLKHAGEVHAFLIEGELEVQIGSETILLSEGDSYSVDASIPHRARNRSGRIARLIWAISPVVIPKDVIDRSAGSRPARKRRPDEP